MAKNYTELNVWRKSMDLVQVVYEVSRKFPGAELYGLTSQIRRAAVSVPSNIAEGEGRGNPGDFLRFLSIANGSLRELETQLMIAVRLGYVSNQSIQTAMNLSSETGRLLNGLKRSLNQRKTNHRKPPTAHCPPPTAHRQPPTAHRPPETDHGL